MIAASAASKALPFGCLVVVFAVSLSLFLIRNKRYVDTLPGLIDDHRNISSIIVQVLSTLLSIAQMLVVCSLVNFAARIKLFQSSMPTSMGALSFWSALSIPRFDSSLPYAKLGLVILVLALGPGLGALWSGSLTPLKSTTLRNDGHVLVPFFNNPIKLTMYPRPSDGAIITDCEPAPSDPRGSTYPDLSTCIVSSRISNLIMTASSATSVTSPRQHPKIDNSTWTYSGRSYGKGSSTGLFYVNGTSTQASDQGFSYTEAGYMTTASCARQSSAVLPFEQYYQESGTLLNLYSANTIMLESGNVSIPPFDVATPAWNGFNSNAFGYCGWATVSNNGINYLAMSSSNWAAGFNDILCTIEFVPMTFLTNVSTVDQFITVTPLGKIDNFNQTGNVPDAIMSDLDLISRLSTSSLGLPSLCSALDTNQGTVKLIHPLASDNRTNEITIETAIVEMADDLLTAQGTLAVARHDGESVAQPVQRHFAAIKIGQSKFQIAQLAINSIFCVAYLFEAIRTRGWKHLPRFDFVDIKALTLAALGPEKSWNRSSFSGSPTASRRSTKARAHSDDTKLTAYYEGNSRPRLCYASPAEEYRHQLSVIGEARPTSADEGSLRSTGNFDISQTDNLVSKAPDSQSTSRTSLLRGS